MGNCDDYWDGKYLHFGAYCEQSASSAEMACGISLSTFHGPHATGDEMETQVGYSWSPYYITCPKCLEWLDTKMKLCDEGCGRKTLYTTCLWCLDFCVCGTVTFSDDSRFIKYEKHYPNCPGRKKATKEEVAEMIKSGKIDS